MKNLRGANQIDLFPDYQSYSQAGNKELRQYFTPEWAADALVSQFFPNLNSDDLVLEPSCGRGAFLKAIPQEIRAIGIELDPELAKIAALESNREVFCGDFRTIPIHTAPTVILGNPPFKNSLICDFLKRSHELLPENGRCGFILPAYAFNYPSTVNLWRQSFSLQSNMLPRKLFPGLIESLVFVIFTKNKLRLLQGLALYDETESVSGLSKWAKLILIHGKPGKPTWKALVEEALRIKGGSAHLKDIYNAVEPKKPETNNWWKEKIRQILQKHFTPLGSGFWQLTPT